MKTIIRFLLLMLLAAPALAQVNSTNVSGTLFPSAVRSANTVTSADQVNAQYKGATFIANVSSLTAGTYTLFIEGKDPVSGNYYPIANTAAISTVSIVALRVYPSLAVTATSVNDYLPRNWRGRLVGSSANMILSVGINLLP